MLKTTLSQMTNKLRTGRQNKCVSQGKEAEKIKLFFSKVNRLAIPLSLTQTFHPKLTKPTEKKRFAFRVLKLAVIEFVWSPGV